MSGMSDVFALLALPFGGVASALSVWTFLSSYSSARRLSAIKKRMGSVSYFDARGISLESTGIFREVLQKIAYLSERAVVPTHMSKACLVLANKRRYESLIQKAGLDEWVTLQGLGQARFLLALSGCLAGMLIGVLFSDVLALIGAAAGTLVGLFLPEKALKNEAHLRSQSVERQLSQMIEVVVLGLQSGLSFDRSLKLYTSYFSGSLSRSFSYALSQWEHGLLDRSETLRRSAATYDSSLFSRVVESIIRSLRFGSSLSESLSLLASEARAVRKSALEEKVAKAPVKMLLPVGALILPAMLILIMGPVLLDLMGGM